MIFGEGVLILEQQRFSFHEIDFSLFELESKHVDTIDFASNLGYCLLFYTFNFSFWSF